MGTHPSFNWGAVPGITIDDGSKTAWIDLFNPLTTDESWLLTKID